jgi:hypothetical protein
MDIVKFLRVILSLSVFLSLYLVIKPGIVLTFDISNFDLYRFFKINFIEIFLLLILFTLIFYVFFRRNG